MFGGKREKALEEELAAARKENERKEELLSGILAQKDVVMEQFARMTASRAQMEKDVSQVKEQVQAIYELAANSEKTAGDIHNTMIETKNGVGTFDANHSVFVKQMRKQDERIMEIVESNKHFTTPMKCITEAQTVYREEQRLLSERAARMIEFSKNMGVLSLNAAIEAGRMGDAGSGFIAAAEEIRAFSENYEREARELQEQLTQSEKRAADLEEQIHYLNELLKENNISMGKLYKDSAQNLATYEGGQTDIRNLISEEIIGRTDALRQSEQECANTQERMLLRLDDVWEEIEDCKDSADELEALWKELYQSAQQGKAEEL